MHSLIRNLKKREGFTLIELMIVVAIIGILAAIAIPNFIKFQLRSKASEGKINLAAIRTAQESYFAEAGTYTAWSVLPTSVPGQAKVNWGGSCPNPLTSTSPGYCFIGWQPEGDIYYQYGVVTVPNASGQANSFSADAQSDIDGDGNFNIWGIQMPNISGSFTAGNGPNGCIAGDVRNVATNAPGLYGQVGPCVSADNGRNVF